ARVAGPRTAASAATRTSAARLLREFNGLQVASPDLIRAPGHPTVEGGRAPHGERDRLSLAQLHLRPDAIALAVRGMEADAGDVLERRAEAAPSDLPLEARIPPCRDTVHVHARAVHVDEAGVEIACGGLRLAAAEAAHSQEGDTQAGDRRRPRDASNRLTHVPSERVGTDARRGLLSGSSPPVQHEAPFHVDRLWP